MHKTFVLISVTMVRTSAAERMRRYRKKMSVEKAQLIKENDKNRHQLGRLEKEECRTLSSVFYGPLILSGNGPFQIMNIDNINEQFENMKRIL